MSDVKRYDPVLEENYGESYAAMEGNSYGDFVAHGDYENLSDEHEVLRRKYNRLVENITELWRDA